MQNEHAFSSLWGKERRGVHLSVCVPILTVFEHDSLRKGSALVFGVFQVRSKLLVFVDFCFACMGVCLSGEFLSPQPTVIVLLLGGVLQSVFLLNSLLLSA